METVDFLLSLFNHREHFFIRLVQIQNPFPNLFRSDRIPFAIPFVRLLEFAFQKQSKFVRVGRACLNRFDSPSCKIYKGTFILFALQQIDDALVQF